MFTRRTEREKCEKPLYSAPLITLIEKKKYILYFLIHHSDIKLSDPPGPKLAF